MTTPATTNSAQDARKTKISISKQAEQIAKKTSFRVSNGVLATSIFSVRMTAALAAAWRAAAKTGTPIQVRSNRYDGFGRLRERGCFYECTVWPDGRANDPYALGVEGMSYTNIHGAALTDEAIAQQNDDHRRVFGATWTDVARTEVKAIMAGK